MMTPTTHSLQDTSRIKCQNSYGDRRIQILYLMTEHDGTIYDRPIRCNRSTMPVMKT